MSNKPPKTDKCAIPHPSNHSIANRPNHPIYVMSIELEEGKNDNIKIYHNSNPDELSYNFCHKNNLDFHSLNYLKTRIQSLITKFKPKNTQKTNSTETNKESTKPSRRNSIGELVLRVHKANVNKKANSKEKHLGKLQNKKNSSSLCKRSISSHKPPIKISSLYINGNFIYKKPVSYRVILPKKESSKSKDRFIHPIIKKGKRTIKNIKYFNKKIIKEHKILKTKGNLNYRKFRYSSSSNTEIKKLSNSFSKCRTQENIKKSASIFKRLTSTFGKEDLILKEKEESGKYTIRVENTIIPKKQKSINQILRRNSHICNYDSESNRPHTEVMEHKIILPYKSRQRGYIFKTEENTKSECMFYSKIVENLYINSERQKKKSNILLVNKEKKNDNSKIGKDNFNKKKEKCFKSIFNSLDSDKDGKISIYAIDLNHLNKEIINMINPIISELNEYQGDINEDDFIIECNKVFELLPFKNRKRLLELVN